MIRIGETLGILLAGSLVGMVIGGIIDSLLLAAPKIE